jgi:hypothetical protein
MSDVEVELIIKYWIMNVNVFGTNLNISDRNMDISCQNMNRYMFKIYFRKIEYWLLTTNFTPPPNGVVVNEL